MTPDWTAVANAAMSCQGMRSATLRTPQLSAALQCCKAFVGGWWRRTDPEYPRFDCWEQIQLHPNGCCTRISCDDRNKERDTRLVMCVGTWNLSRAVEGGPLGIEIRFRSMWRRTSAWWQSEEEPWKLATVLPEQLAAVQTSLSGF